ncbi:hypothetical protein F5051DRAFT_482788 [Lentinula edodes]|nr:hypothetical protein F5051DRAFT_482788 [Lentinula edodes]
MSVASASLKRTQAQISPRKGNIAKKARVVPTDSDSSSDDNPSEEPRKDAYLTLSPPVSSYVQLCVQLCRFKGVWRQVRVPTNYTFANLHSGSGTTLSSNISSDGVEWRLLEDPDDTHHLAEHDYFGRDRTLAEYDLTIGQVWNRQLTHNAYRGKCLNKEIAIEYEYGLRASWEVHITLDKDDEFFTVNPPNNLPIIVKAKGAPPVEDSYDDDAKDKTISPLLSDAENFQLYCDEKFQTRTGKEELECQFCGMSEEDISALQQRRQANTKTKPKWDRYTGGTRVEQIEQRKAKKLVHIEKLEAYRGPGRKRRIQMRIRIRKTSLGDAQ